MSYEISLLSLLTSDTGGCLFAVEITPSLAKPPLKFNGISVNCGNCLDKNLHWQSAANSNISYKLCIQFLCVIFWLDTDQFYPYSSGLLNFWWDNHMSLLHFLWTYHDSEIGHILATKFLFDCLRYNFFLNCHLSLKVYHTYNISETLWKQHKNIMISGEVLSILLSKLLSLQHLEMVLVFFRQGHIHSKVVLNCCHLHSQY